MGMAADGRSERPGFRRTLRIAGFMSDLRMILLCAASLVGMSQGPVSASARPSGEPEAASAGIEFFETKIRPVLVERCYKCHSAEGKGAKGGLRLDGSAAIRHGGDSGPMLGDTEPGQIKADESLLLAALSHGGEIAAMPPDKKLAERTIADFRQWVERGAPMPDHAPAGKDQNVQPSKAKPGIDFDAGRKYWAFVPAVEQAVPSVSNPEWARTRIDPFILAELDTHNLTPSPLADRRTLIRRLSLDLTGLPPTADEVFAFIADPAVDAEDRLVDRLLASPRYGERWGRHWLDVARYAEDNPTSEATSKPPRNAHVYRDWVIGAINADLPYNEFIRRQLAADLEPGLPPTEIAATGFIGLAPVYHKEPKLSAEVIGAIVADEWDERLDTVTRGVLGLTVACARCHDHKFDPIGTADYYALAGVFASTQLAERALISADTQTTEELANNRRLLVDLEQRLNYAEEQKGVVEKAHGDVEQAKRSVEEYKAKVKQARDRKRFDGPTAPAVLDAALWVDGSDPSWTNMDYRTGVGRDLPIFVRGSLTNPGPITPRRFLAVLSPGEPEPFSGPGSGRLALADAIVGPAQSLAARVIVNRVWSWHFGRPIVSTPSNFGKLGEAPTHPALLDDLAARFIAAGWSLKWLHREIVRSSTYRQSSQGPESTADRFRDPENRWLGRFERRRLDVEAWRDALLAVDGSIDLDNVGGRSGDLDRSEFHGRTVYGKVSRQRLADVLKTFDFPDPNRHGESRDQTTTPLQQLYFLNSPFLLDRAATLARKITADDVPTDPAIRVRTIYQRVLQRDPTVDELARAVRFIERDGGADRPESWTLLAQSVLISNEFLFVD